MQTVDRSSAATGSQPSEGVERVYGGRSDARGRVVDQFVVARVVAAVGCVGHARRSANRSSLAASLGTGASHGAEEEDDGSSSRPQRAVREHCEIAARVHGDGRPDRQHRHEKEGIAGELSSFRCNVHAANGGNERPRFRQRRRWQSHSARSVRRGPRPCAHQPEHDTTRESCVATAWRRGGRSTAGRRIRRRGGC